MLESDTNLALGIFNCRDLRGLLRFTADWRGRKALIFPQIEAASKWRTAGKIKYVDLCGFMWIYVDGLAGRNVDERNSIVRFVANDSSALKTRYEC
jgi:hypothetical protein